MFKTRDSSSGRYGKLLNTLAIALGCSVALGLIEATSVHAMLTAVGPGRGWAYTLAMTMPSWILMAAFVPFVLSAARRFSFDRGSWRTSTAIHLSNSVMLVVLHLVVLSLTWTLFDGPTTWAHFTHLFSLCFRYLFALEVLIYWTIVGVYLAIYFSNLRTCLAEARLLALRTQLNPHFLFNTLHAISVLALKGEHAAVAEMLGRLSDLLRAALDGEAREVPLAVEIDFVDNYMALQRVRFADRLKVEKLIAPEALSSLVPTMILQPIVENAIKHGVSAQRGAGVVDITAERLNGSLVVEVRDTGPGFPPDGPRDGIGLSNTRARLEQMYGSEHRFECGRSPMGGASVRIVIPFRQTAA